MQQQQKAGMSHRCIDLFKINTSGLVPCQNMQTHAAGMGSREEPQMLSPLEDQPALLATLSKRAGTQQQWEAVMSVSGLPICPGVQTCCSVEMHKCMKSMSLRFEVSKK